MKYFIRLLIKIMKKIFFNMFLLILCNPDQNVAAIHPKSIESEQKL